jgi:hypothetical protein
MVLCLEIIFIKKKDFSISGLCLHHFSLWNLHINKTIFHVIDPQSEKDKDQASLVEILRKQNVQSGLTTINNKAFHFFVDLDNSIQRLETIENLALHGKSFFFFLNFQFSFIILSEL